jgi:hypothetical protein
VGDWRVPYEHSLTDGIRRAGVYGLGEVFLVWTEGTGWKKGGVITGQRFDRNWKPVGEAMVPAAIPAWAFASAVAAQGRFEVVC